MRNGPTLLLICMTRAPAGAAKPTNDGQPKPPDMRNTSAIRPKTILLSSLALLLNLISSALAQENGELGRMWTFENPPLEYLEQEYGFRPDQNWLDSLRLGSLRLGGEDIQSGIGSASLVSPNGLIMTSTRCVRKAVTVTREQDREIIRAGFVATTQEQEFRLRSSHDKWLTAAQLIKISNITEAVDNGVAATDDEIRIRKKREANTKAVLDAARRSDPDLVPQIVSLYQGAVVQLYQYKVYDDIRLVVLPHVQTAHFGGAPDSFTYPRHSLDFAFLRAYEDGKPADTKEHYFKWKPGSARKDDLVFVSGNPGTTGRWLTKAQMELERDFRVPMNIEHLSNKLRSFGSFYADHPQLSPLGSPTILGLEDGIKAGRGNLNGLEDATLMAQKAAAEKAFQDRVMADKALAKKYGDLWDRIASVVQEQRQHEPRAQFQTPDGFSVLGIAVAIVRSFDPAETEEHRRQARKRIERSAGTTNSPAYLAIVFGADHYARARSWLPEDDPLFTRVLGGKTPGEFWEMLDGRQARQSPSWIGYPEPRDALIKAGWPTIRDSEDPAIVAARELVVLIRKNEQLSEELDAKEAALGAEIGRALLECYGKKVSPDGTMTPRFTDGVVRGFPFNGTIAPHRKTFYGLYGRNVEFGNEYPFNLPKIWLDRKDEIDMTKTVNFVSTNDITSSGGSSGSVVVNKELEVVGVVVDGNIESLHNDSVFRDDVPRTVSTHVDGIMEALVKIYEAGRIVKELSGN